MSTATCGPTSRCDSGGGSPQKRSESHLHVRWVLRVAAQLRELRHCHGGSRGSGGEPQHVCDVGSPACAFRELLMYGEELKGFECASAPDSESFEATNCAAVPAVCWRRWWRWYCQEWTAATEEL